MSLQSADIFANRWCGLNVDHAFLKAFGRQWITVVWGQLGLHSKKKKKGLSSGMVVYFCNPHTQRPRQGKSDFEPSQSYICDLFFFFFLNPKEECKYEILFNK